ncbi:RNA polymerase sigma factor [Belliella kenyensis]|uniref:RNA polymerase sigma factor n=1 Tax=Belliella kenyensis TaxID=1472724 RepID=A0ABV8EFP5_9BACT|nr:RNA polymerase sigma factor [Belliella kenyensis]MCH7401838.1 RNA polymerase sigma factor [Belliella kenyensis]MDN3604338.1 RNA polymerase sigma factor [Belliella kenyensis]
MITEEEFTRIYYHAAPKVQRLCLGYASGNKDLANEWLQETFIKVWTHRKSFEGKSSVDTWIYRIAVNVCLGNLRKSKQIITSENVHMIDIPIEDTDENDEKKINTMFECINQLNEQNKALILLELEEVSQSTIAETVGLAQGTLRTRLSRIRQSLLKCIKNGKR